MNQTTFSIARINQAKPTRFFAALIAVLFSLSSVVPLQAEEASSVPIPIIREPISATLVSKVADRDGANQPFHDRLGNGTTTKREWIVLGYMLRDVTTPHFTTYNAAMMSPDVYIDRSNLKFLDLTGDGLVDQYDLDVYFKSLPSEINRDLLNLSMDSAASADMDHDGVLTDLEIVGSKLLSPVVQPQCALDGTCDALYFPSDAILEQLEAPENAKEMARIFHALDRNENRKIEALELSRIHELNLDPNLVRQFLDLMDGKKGLAINAPDSVEVKYGENKVVTVEAKTNLDQKIQVSLGKHPDFIDLKEVQSENGLYKGELSFNGGAFTIFSPILMSNFNLEILASNSVEQATHIVHVTVVMPRGMKLDAPQEVKGKVGTEIKFTVFASSYDGLVKDLKADGLPDDASFTPEGVMCIPEDRYCGNSKAGTFTWTPKPGQDGDATVSFFATDGISNMNAKTVMHVEAVVNQKPVLNLPDNISGTAGKPLNFTVSAYDLDGRVTGINAEPLPEGATFILAPFAVACRCDNNTVCPPCTQAMASFNWDKPVAGDYPTKFIAYDDQENSIIIERMIHIEKAQNVIVISNPQNVDARILERITFTVGAVNAKSLEATGLPEGARFDYGLNDSNPISCLISDVGGPTLCKIFDWTPREDQAGEQNVTFMATDEWGNKSDSSTHILVNYVDNKLPMIEAPQEVRPDENGHIEFMVNTKDEDGYMQDILLKGALPQGATFQVLHRMCLNGGILPCPPETELSGIFKWDIRTDSSDIYTTNHLFTFVAVDNRKGTSTAATNVVLNMKNQNPTLQGPAGVYATAGMPIEDFQVSAFDKDGMVKDIKAYGLPDGATFMTNNQVRCPMYACMIGNDCPPCPQMTGAVSWEKPRAGEYSILFVAYDDQGGQSERFVVPLHVTAGQVSINAPQQVNGTILKRITFVVSTANAVTLDAKDLPEGARFDSISNQLACAATENSICKIFDWMPREDQAGKPVITFMAKDDQGNEAKPVMTEITVQYVENIRPTVTSPKEVSPDSQGHVEFQVKAVDQDGYLEDLWLSSDTPLPEGASFVVSRIVCITTPCIQKEMTGIFKWDLKPGQPGKQFTFYAKDNRKGEALPSTTVVMIPVIQDPKLLNAVSFREHKVFGRVGIELDVSGSTMATENRLYGAKEVQLTFDQNVSSQNVRIALEGGYLKGVNQDSNNSRSLRLMMETKDLNIVKIKITTAHAYKEVSMRVLTGDVGDLGSDDKIIPNGCTVNQDDFDMIKRNMGSTDRNVLLHYDITMDGAISVSDLLAARTNTKPVSNTDSTLTKSVGC